MSERPDFGTAWRALDDAMARVRPPPALDARIGSATARRLPRAGSAVLAVGMAAALALIVLWPRRDVEVAIAVGDAVVFVPASCAPAVVEAELALGEGCRVVLESPELAIEARTRVLLRRTTSGIRILEGTAAFMVEKVEHDPVVVLVSGGRIEVVGTRFVIRETGASGTVTLEEGRIAFVTLSGARRDLAPGGVYEWEPRRSNRATAEAAVPEEQPTPMAAATDPAQPPAPPSPPRSVQRSSRAPAVPRLDPPDPTPRIPERAEEETVPPPRWSAEQTARVVERVSELRAEGRYREAARWIAKLLEAPLDARAAEVLSFERGEILEHKLLLRSDACLHWRSHAERFPDGRYRAEVAKALAVCVLR